MKLLNDHLRITLPDGADYFTPAVGLMEADHNSGETSIMVGKDDSSICVQVEEKQCLADDKFAEGVKKAMSNLNREDNYFIIDQMGDNLVYALFRKGSDKVLPGRHAPYAYAEYRHPDGTVQKFTILVAKDAAKDVEKTHAMVKGWLKSVKPGATPLNLKERVEHQVSYMKELTRLAVPVPEGYTSTLNDGEGFHFATYTKLGKPGEAREELSVQVGDHPEIWFREIPSSKQKTQSGTLLGQKVEWHLSARLMRPRWRNACCPWACAAERWISPRRAMARLSMSVPPSSARMPPPAPNSFNRQRKSPCKRNPNPDYSAVASAV